SRRPSGGGTRMRVRHGMRGGSGPRAVVLLLGMALVAAACGGKSAPPGSQGSGTPGPTSAGGSVQKGGVYRTAIEDFGFTGAFDPTGEYLGNAWGLYSEMLLRNLVTFKHVEGVAGDEIVPDPATNTGDISADGLPY